jgi:hypothetical protein
MVEGLTSAFSCNKVLLKLFLNELASDAAGAGAECVVVSAGIFFKA